MEERESEREIEVEERESEREIGVEERENERETIRHKEKQWGKSRDTNRQKQKMRE